MVKVKEVVVGKTKRRRNRRKRRVAPKGGAIVSAMPAGSNNDRGRRKRGTGLGSLRGLEPSSAAFLRTVLAPYDFAQLGCGGVPDSYSGPTFTITQRQLFSAAQGSEEQYFAVLPTPQVAFWVATGAVTRSTPFIATPFIDQATFSAALSVAPQMVESMRVIGMSVEVKCVGPALTTQGIIAVSRGEVRLEPVHVSRTIPATGGVTPQGVTVVGLRTMANGMYTSSNYTGRLRDGVFAVARHVGPWAFSDGLDIEPADAVAGGIINIPAIPDPEAYVDGVLRVENGTSSAIGSSLDWYDNNMEALMINVSPVPSGGVASAFTIEVIMTVEARPSKQSVLAKIAAPSPTEDPAAMMLYDQLVQNMPIGVPARMNANWWNNLLSILRTVGFVASHVPGPIGMAGKGVDLLGEAFEQIFI